MTFVVLGEHPDSLVETHVYVCTKWSICLCYIVHKKESSEAQLLNNATDGAWRSAYKITRAALFCNFKTLYNNSLTLNALLNVQERQDRQDRLSVVCGLLVRRLATSCQ